KPISKNQLAKLLASVEVGTDNIRFGKEVKKGYQLFRFEDAFARYLLDPLSETLQRYTPTAAGTSPTFQNATPESDVAFQKSEKPLGPSGSSGVADRKGGQEGFASEEVGESESDTPTVATEPDNWAFNSEPPAPAPVAVKTKVVRDAPGAT